MNPLTIRNLGFEYPSGFRIQDISLSVPEGKIFGITGPNGSGKSTLLKIIGGAISGYSGDIMLGEQNFGAMPAEHRARITGFVPQSFPVSFPVTVNDFVLQGRHPYQAPFRFESAEDIGIAEECIELAGIREFKNRNIQTLSGGELRLILLARALCQKPKILLLDEVTTNLDINIEFAITGLLETLRDQGLMIILVSHDISLISETAGEVIVMKKGKIVFAGMPDEVFAPEMFRSVYGLNVRIEKLPQSNRLIPVRVQ